MSVQAFHQSPGTPAEPKPTPLALRLREAAAAISVSPSTMERLVRAGEIDSVLCGRVRLFELSALKDFLERHRVSRTGPGPGGQQ
jgi:excisionase family DNA binding protein